MCRYHTVIGNQLTVYLHLKEGTDGPPPTDNILDEIDKAWAPIAAAHQMTFGVALHPDTPAPLDALPPNIAVTTNATAPSGTDFFEFTVGRGAEAAKDTRSGRISYAGYDDGTGYIYHNDDEPGSSFVPAIAHELGHVLGLSDRYYEGLYWLMNVRMDLTCAKIRARAYVDSGTDYRGGVLDKPQTFMARLGVRATLPMGKAMVSDPDYDPYDNLLSTSAAKLTDAQMDIIKQCKREKNYRLHNWVIVLGPWRRHAGSTSDPVPQPHPGARAQDSDTPDDHNDLSQWIYPPWEAGPQDGGSGLLFLPPGHVTPHRYAAMRVGKRARFPDGTVAIATRLSVIQGKKKVSIFNGSAYNTNGINYFPEKMCHARQLLHDLMRNS